MTSPLNLPAPGRCQAIYVLLTNLHSHVFLLNSRLGLFSAATIASGVLFPEVTGLFCLVP
jgi:hypothetical protein